MPHAHILLWLSEKIRPNQIDDVISAEIPDPAEDPQLYNIITKHLIHGPCGPLNVTSPCMKDGKCTKKYPRSFLKETVTAENGYPLYRRRSPQDGGRTFMNSNNVTIDNRWVVPYSQILCKMFDAHINVEYCNSVRAIKYICKYIHKGSDRAVFEINNNSLNEVVTYQSSHYISCCLANFKFSIT